MAKDKDDAPAVDAAQAGGQPATARFCDATILNSFKKQQFIFILINFVKHMQNILNSNEIEGRYFNLFIRYLCLSF